MDLRLLRPDRYSSAVVLPLCRLSPFVRDLIKDGPPLPLLRCSLELETDLLLYSNRFPPLQPSNIISISSTSLFLNSSPIMPTDDSPRMIALARHSANAPLYSPTKVTRTYGRKLRTLRNGLESSGSAQKPIVLSDDASDDGQGTSLLNQKFNATLANTQDSDHCALGQSKSHPHSNHGSLAQHSKDATEDVKCTEDKLHSYLLKDAEDLTCMICLDLVNRPHILVCCHFFCATCISLYARNLVQRKVNFHCPYCQKTIGCSTPVESLYMQERSCVLREALNLTPVSRGSLTWPAEFTSPKVALPFPEEDEDEVVIL